MSTANLPVSPADLAVAQSRHTVWATVFTVWATEKTVAQTVEVPLGHEKRAPQRPLSSFALQRYNKTRRKANRRRRTQNGKIRKKGKWRRVVVPCPLTWHSVIVAAPAATPFLCRRNAAVQGTIRFRPWREGTISIPLLWVLQTLLARTMQSVGIVAQCIVHMSVGESGLNCTNGLFTF